MHSEDLLIDDCCDWQAIEAICEGLPQLDVVSPLALVIETVNSVDRRTFVVPAQNEKILRVFDLVCE